MRRKFLSLSSFSLMSWAFLGLSLSNESTACEVFNSSEETIHVTIKYKADVRERHRHLYVSNNWQKTAILKPQERIRIGRDSPDDKGAILDKCFLVETEIHRYINMHGFAIEINQNNIPQMAQGYLNYGNKDTADALMKLPYPTIHWDGQIGWIETENQTTEERHKLHGENALRRLLAVHGAEKRQFNQEQDRRKEPHKFALEVFARQKEIDSLKKSCEWIKQQNQKKQKDLSDSSETSNSIDFLEQHQSALAFYQEQQNAVSLEEKPRLIAEAKECIAVCDRMENEFKARQAAEIEDLKRRWK